MLPATIFFTSGNFCYCFSLDCAHENQVDAIRSLTNNEHVAHFMNSSLSKTEIQKVKSDIREGKTKMLYVAPESLTKRII